MMKVFLFASYSSSSTVSRWLFITLFLINGQGLTSIIYGWIIGDAASAIMALIVAIAQQIVYNAQFLPAYIAIGVAAYAITTRTLKTLNKEDKQLIKEIAGQKQQT